MTAPLAVRPAAALGPDVAAALAAIPIDQSKFTALWNALWRGGVFVYVPAGVDALAPVWIAHAAAGEGMVTFPTTVILLEDRASLTVVDTYQSPPGDATLLSN